MLTRNTFVLFLAAMFILPWALVAEEKVDLAMVHRIKQEAFDNSKVMDHLFYLTDVQGPRLAGSPAYTAAADWAIKRMKEMGVENARLEKWGAVGRSWTFTRFSAHLLEPAYAPLIGFPLAWTQGTNGTVVAEPVLAVLRTDADLEKFKGKLKGKIVLIEAARDLTPQTTAASSRYSDQQLSEMAMASDPTPPRPGPDSPAARFAQALGPGQPDFRQMMGFRNKLRTWLRDEGVLATVSSGYRGDGGTVFSSSGGSREVKDPVAVTGIAITGEHYNRIVRLLGKNIPVKIELEVKAEVGDKEVDGYNVIAEIPGGRRRDEVVMVGGHLDSWHGGTGATDDATGCAVAMEAVRILKALNVNMDRTVRMALWDAEEQGLLGSRGYVKEHFADRENMQLKPEHGKLSAYYNLDNGTGKIRGVYLQNNDMVRPVFEAYLRPFRDLGATTLTIRNTSGTDHLSFDAVGLPGFQFIQDPVEYGTRTHHSNMDVYDRVQRGDMIQASAIMASFIYHTATREELIPRKPLPKPQPRREPGAPKPSN